MFFYIIELKAWTILLLPWESKELCVLCPIRRITPFKFVKAASVNYWGQGHTLSESEWAGGETEKGLVEPVSLWVDWFVGLKMDVYFRGMLSKHQRSSLLLTVFIKQRLSFLKGSELYVTGICNSFVFIFNFPFKVALNNHPISLPLGSQGSVVRSHCLNCFNNLSINGHCYALPLILGWKTRNKKFVLSNFVNTARSVLLQEKWPVLVFYMHLDRNDFCYNVSFSYLGHW